MRYRRAWCGLALLAVLAGCGEPRRFGDAGGVPVAFTVTLDRAFVSGMRNRQGRVGLGVGGSLSSGGHSSVGTGVGLSFASTTVYLVGGDGPGEAQVFRQELKWGENGFTVPLTPARTLHLTVQVQGGRDGWEAIGPVTLPAVDHPTVTIGLSDAGPRISAQ
jgi:hypothetical protein